MTFWLAVASHDAEKAQALLEEEWRSLLPETVCSTEAVLDFDAPTMTCPACSTTFDTGPTECPDCGLYIGP